MNGASRVFVGALVIALLVGAFLWWRKQQEPPPPPPPVTPHAVTPSAAPLPPDAAEPAVRHEIERAAEAEELPPLAESDGYVAKALDALLGRKSVRSFLHVDSFVNRFVATVDNLAGGHAPARLWPVVPLAGRFETERSPAGTTIAADNASRYAPFVRFAEGVNTRRAAVLYRRLYPLFQQAYEDLGHPGKYFNDRVVEVIDHLLATPEIAGPIGVTRIEDPSRPEGLFRFQDPTLESRSAGQKILLRMGPEHARRLKAKLADLREQIARRPPARR